MKEDTVEWEVIEEKEYLDSNENDG
jgi:hypothetical protein